MALIRGGGWGITVSGITSRGIMWSEAVKGTAVSWKTVGGINRLGCCMLRHCSVGITVRVITVRVITVRGIIVKGITLCGTEIS